MHAETLGLFCNIKRMIDYLHEMISFTWICKIFRFVFCFDRLTVYIIGMFNASEANFLRHSQLEEFKDFCWPSRPNKYSKLMQQH